MVRKERTSDKKSKQKAPYLTKRILDKRREIRNTQKFAEETMLVTPGYAIAAKNGWLVKKYPDGSIEKISRITHGTDQKEDAPRLTPRAYASQSLCGT